MMHDFEYHTSMGSSIIIVVALRLDKEFCSGIVRNAYDMGSGYLQMCGPNRAEILAWVE